MTIRLGVNIDHVATLRQARGEEYPSLVQAARVCLQNQADQITIHLREDRRHIQDLDVEAIKLVTREFNRPLNLEMGCSDDIFNIAIATKPDWVCLVPEKREERTTEGGLDLKSKDNFHKIEKTITSLKKNINGLKISLFIEADKSTMEIAKQMNIDAVEIHTGEYAQAYNQGDDTQKYFDQFKIAYELIKNTHISFHAGHGLTFKNTKDLLGLKIFSEYNIGHWIISESIFKGLGLVVKDFKGLLDENC